MSKVLIILTHFFPYNPPTEQFLLTELSFLSDKFDKIVLLPTSRTKGKVSFYDINFENVECFPIERKSKFIEITSGFITNALFRLSFWKELFCILLSSSQTKKQNMSLLFDYYAKNGGLFLQLRKLLFHNHMIDKKDELLIYSYWFNSNAVLNVMLKQYLVRKKWLHVKSVSRAHGLGDLYLEYRPRISFLNANLDRIFPISSGGFDFLRNSGIKQNLMSVHRLGVSQRNINFHSQSENVEIVSCSMLTVNKQVCKIIDGLSLISDFKIVWTHFGSGELLNELIEQCKAKLPANIEWTFRGNVSNNSILEYYLNKSPRCLINTSKIEGIPVSIMEAFSCGIPAIATDVGATSEIVENGINGFLLNVDFSSQQLADCIKMICSLPDIYSSMRINAYQKWRTMYSSTDNYRSFSEECLRTLEE